MNRKITFRDGYTLLLFLALCTWTVSCSKDKSTPEPSAEELILGKWYVVKITKADGSIHEPANDCEKDSHYKFDDEKQITSISFHLDGDECKRFINAGDYLLADDGKKLIVTTSDGVTSAIDILLLNETTLELKIAGDTAHLKKGHR